MVFWRAAAVAADGVGLGGVGSLGDQAVGAVGRAMTGRKDDAGKRDFTLLPWRSVGLVVDVLAHGAAKYGRENWRAVEAGERRYLAAAFRHLAAYAEGERIDSDSGLSHIAHAACCLLFLLALEP